MTYTATITSKNQLTIPSVVAKKLNLKKGTQVSIEVNEDNSMQITSMEAIVNQLAGSVKSRKKLSDKELEVVIERSKDMYFSKHFT